MNSKYIILTISILLTSVIGSFSMHHFSMQKVNTQVNIRDEIVPDTAINKKVIKSESEKNEIYDNEEFKNLESELDDLENDNKSTDTTTIKVGKIKITVIDDGNDIIINKEDDWDSDEWDEDWSWHDDNDFNIHKRDKEKFKPHWAGISLGLNNYVTSDFSTNLVSNQDTNLHLLAVNTNNSLEFNLNLGQFGLNIIKNRVGIVSGIGLKWNNYKFRNTNTILVSDSTPLYYYEDSENSFKFSKLTTLYMIVPVLIEFQIPTHNKPLYIMAGVEGGIKLGAWTKLKGNDKQKIKNKKDFHTVPWDARITARIGYGNFGLFGTYGLLSVFEVDKGPELHALTIGASLNF